MSKSRVEDHEIGHTLAADSLPDGSVGRISTNPGQDDDGPYAGICGAYASSHRSAAIVHAAGFVGEAVFGWGADPFSKTSSDYRRMDEACNKAGITHQEAKVAARQLLDTPENHLVHKALKAGLRANGGELSASRVESIIRKAKAPKVAETITLTATAADSTGGGWIVAGLFAAVIVVVGVMISGESAPAGSATTYRSTKLSGNPQQIRVEASPLEQIGRGAQQVWKEWTE